MAFTWIQGPKTWFYKYVFNNRKDHFESEWHMLSDVYEWVIILSSKLYE